MKKFQRTVENFECEYCGFFVEGNGYTNHCPKCLWGKHVDLFPGDRLSRCQGMMMPVEVLPGKTFSLLHRCQKCGAEKRNKVAIKDDLETFLVSLAQIARS
ncbi:MAG TPA: RNHCP domain-containing protein [Candidatus Paceibacterota bacterium]|nr:RNHCP domain-containing protein [Candidatus Paceibacterota bacterium]